MKMKKLIVLALALMLVAGCSTPAPKMGLGVVSEVTITPVGEKDGKAVDGKTQVNTTVCAVTLDANGKIVSVSWDGTQGKAAFDKTGAAVSQPGEVVSKKALKDAYGMKKASAIQKEWYEQIEALEAYAKGKMPAAIIDMQTMDKGDGSHTNVPDVEELKTSCTITIQEYQQSLKKAVENAK